jgi:hypothetical protein
VKTRNGWVSNSSSSSFVIAIKEEEIKLKEMFPTMERVKRSGTFL